MVWIGKKPSMFYFCSGMDWLKKKLNDKCLIGNFKKVLLLFFEKIFKVIGRSSCKVQWNRKKPCFEKSRRI